MIWRSPIARATLGVLVIAALAGIGWVIRQARSSAAGEAGLTDRAIPGRAPAAPRAARAPAAAGTAPDAVRITGQVIEIPQRRPVAGVEVVLRGAAGEATTTTRRDGGYTIQVAPGSYRAFVRDPGVLSIARSDPPRLPGPVEPDAVGVPDEALMSALVARKDLAGIDLAVVRSGVIAGQVVDGAGQAVDGAIVQAFGGAVRPALATDRAASGADGRFELHLPPGNVLLTASHPRFAGIARDDRTPFAVRPGDRLEVKLVMSRGCVVRGRVVTRDGAPAGDGALERQWGVGEFAFRPAGQIAPDGSFRWSSSEEDDVTLRAWPWASPPSPARRFACRDGARFDHVVFRLPERRPDLQGMLVDRAGQPVEFTFLDIRPLDPDNASLNVAQQERTDATGRWTIHALPPGSYRIVAQAEGRGVISATVVAPHAGVRLELGGTGRLEGTTPHLAGGSFELELTSCGDAAEPLALAPSPTLVPVIGGRFTVDGVPACKLAFRASYRGRARTYEVAVPAGGAAQLEIDLGEPRPKVVHGVVRDLAGAPVPDAMISAPPTEAGGAEVNAVGDASGRFTIRAFSGAKLSAVAAGKFGEAVVGGANIDAEQVDIVIDGAPPGAGHVD